VDYIEAAGRGFESAQHRRVQPTALAKILPSAETHTCRSAALPPVITRCRDSRHTGHANL